MRFILLFFLLLAALPVSWAGAGDLTDLTNLDAQIGQMLMVGFRGLTLEPDSPIARDIAQGRIGGVVLFDRDLNLPGEPRNIQSQGQLALLTSQLQRASAIPLFIAVDQEGGKVQRLRARHGFPAFPSAKALGAGMPQDTRIVARNMGRVLARAGCNLDFAPVVDLDINPQSPAIGALERSFGADPEIVANHAGAFISGLADQGILACPKHFPGHGSSTGDTHLGLTDVTGTWRKTELVPYRRLLAQGLCPMIMTAHIVHRGLDPRYPATLSRAVVTGLLRMELGFSGVVVSDDMQMGAVARDYPLRERLALAVNAGVDLLLFGNNLSYEPEIAEKSVGLLKDMVQQGLIPRWRIEESCARILDLKKRLR